MKPALRYLLIGLGALAGGTVIAVAVNKGNQRIVLKKSNRLLFIGDSYTAGGSSYADQLKKLLPGVQITKIAKVGATTEWMLKNAADEMASGKYAAVFILGGVNDIYALNSIDRTQVNLQQMYDMANGSGAKVVALTINPTDAYEKYDDKKGLLTHQLNQWIKKSKIPDTVIDFNAMLRKNTRQNLDLFTADKLHANTNAHFLLAQEIKKKLF